MTDVIIPSLKVNPEFQTLIPPLADDEYKRLEASLVNNGWEGWRGPILVWDGVIVDGHNRYRICQEHGIAFTTKEMRFSDEDSAKLFIIDNQLKRRNLPPAAIGDLKLEEKDIVARQAKEHSLANLKKGSKSLDEPNLARRKDGGRTLEILARDIQMGRESLRKLDVIKQKAKEGDPVAIREREALISGEKKSIHGAYVAVVGKPKKRKPEEMVAEDGRKICAMCGEPIDEGDALPSRPTIHKKCEKEYQQDWERKKKLKYADDGRRICSICGEPIDEGDHYQDKLNWHYQCGLKHALDVQRQYRNADHDLINNTPTYTVESLLGELTASAENMRDAMEESIAINESMGVNLTSAQRKRLDRAILQVFKTIQKIRKEADNG